MEVKSDRNQQELFYSHNSTFEDFCMLFSGDDELLVWLSSEVVLIFPLCAFCAKELGRSATVSVSVVNRMVINDHA